MLTIGANLFYLETVNHFLQRGHAQKLKIILGVSQRI